MLSHKRYIQYRKDELYHYNHNHDRRNGRFTSGPGGTTGKTDSKKEGESVSQADYDGNTVPKSDSKTDSDKASEKQSDEKKISGEDVGKFLVEECGFKEDDYSKYGLTDKYYNKRAAVKDSNGNDINLNVIISNRAPAFTDGTNVERLRRDVSDLEKYWSNIDKTVKHQVAQELFSMGVWADEGRSDGQQHSVEDIEKKIGTWDNKPRNVTIRFDPSSEELRSRNYGEINYADGDLYWGHTICAQYDFDHGYVEDVLIEG